MVEERLTLTLTGWFGGWKGRTLGLRVSTSDRKRLFLDRRLKNRLQREGLDMVLPEGTEDVTTVSVTVSPSFWKKCPSFRSRQIGDWMKLRGDCAQDGPPWWPERENPKYVGKLITDGGRPVTLRVLG